MPQNKNQFLVLIVLGFILLAIAVNIIIKDTDLVLGKQTSIKGRVADYGVTSYYSGKISKRVFYIELDNSNYKFAIMNNNQDFGNMEATLSKLDSVKIYYRNSFETLNRNVFQIESSEGVLYDYKDYNKSHSTAAVAAIFMGLFIILVGFLKYKRINIGKF